MSKRNYGINQEKIKQYIKEGRGQGEGKDYKPWISIQDFPSKGKVSRYFSWKCERMHQFMSDLELNYFYILLWSDKVIDIREQYPLLDIEAAMRIAEEKGIKYPVAPNSKEPIVMTTDFMITVVEDGKRKDIARTIKQSKELEKKRVIEKFEIEREYWKEKGIDWGIVTEKEIPKMLALNIEWVFSAYVLETSDEMNINDLIRYASILKDRLQKNSRVIINEFLTSLDKEYGLSDGSFLYLFKHLIATKQIHIDNMFQKIDLSKNIRDVVAF